MINTHGSGNSVYRMRAAQKTIVSCQKKFGSATVAYVSSNIAMTDAEKRSLCIRLLLLLLVIVVGFI